MEDMVADMEDMVVDMEGMVVFIQTMEHQKAILSGWQKVKWNFLKTGLYEFLESSRGAFQSIESVVNAFASVANMLSSTHNAVFSSFRAVIGLVEQFSTMKKTVGFPRLNLED